jgi:hypothetical protein
MPALKLHARSTSTSLSPTSLAFTIIGSICALVALITVCIIFPRLRLYVQPNGADSSFHSKWTSSQTSFRSNSPEESFKHLISKPAEMSQVPITKDHGIEAEQVSPESSTESLALPDRPVSIISPLERERYSLYPTTSTSYLTYATAPSPSISYFTTPSPSMTHVTTLSIPSPAFTYGELSPTSPTPTTFTYSRVSMPAVQEAIQMSFTRAAVKKLGTIRKTRKMKIKRTIDVRVSNHTNHGSPIRVGRPEARW